MRRILVWALVGSLLFASDVTLERFDPFSTISHMPVARLRAAAAYIASVGVPWPTASDGSETTASINTTGATLIVLWQCYASSGSPSTPTDSQSNAYTALTTRFGGSAFGRFYYKASPSTSATHTFTTAGGANGYQSIHASAYSGTHASAPFDVENGTAVSSLTTGSVTPSTNNQLIVAGVVHGFDGAGENVTAISGTGMTENTGEVVNTLAYGCATGRAIQTTAAAINSTFTLSASNAESGAGIATFKEAVASTGGPRLMRGYGP